MTMLLLYGSITPGQSGWRMYVSDDPALRVLLRQAEMQDRRAFANAYLLTDDGRVLAARMRATVEDEQRRITFASLSDEQPVNPVVVSWPATYDELGDRPDSESRDPLRRGEAE